MPGAAGLSTFLKPGLTGRGSHRGQCWLIPYISLESLAISRVVISVESSRFHGSLPRRFLVAPDPPRSLAMPPKTLAPTPGSLSLALHFALLSAIAKGVSPASSVAFGEALDTFIRPSWTGAYPPAHSSLGGGLPNDFCLIWGLRPKVWGGGQELF